METSKVRETAPTAFQAYWDAYGGYRKLLRSAYLWLSVGLAWALVPAWDTRFQMSAPWVEIALTVIPSIVSFSLGAMAIILSIASGKFLKIIQQKGRSDSFFMKMVAAFFHFIIVQFAALFLAIVCNFYVFWPLSLLGFSVFLYALACGIAASAALMDVALLRNKAAVLDVEESDAASLGCALYTSNPQIGIFFPTKGQSVKVPNGRPVLDRWPRRPRWLRRRRSAGGAG